MAETRQFDSGATATIASGMKVLAGLGRVVIDDGHLGLLRDNGDLIDSAAMSAVTLKKGLTYALVPTLHVLLNGTKYLVNLSYQALINAGYGDAEAKDAQRAQNIEFVGIVRSLGGDIKGL